MWDHRHGNASHGCCVLRLALRLTLTLSAFQQILSFQSPRIAGQLHRLGRLRTSRPDPTYRRGYSPSSLPAATEDEATDIPENRVADGSTRGEASSSPDGDKVKWSQVRAWESDTFKWSVVQEREAEINRLKFLLADANGAVEDGERRAEEAEKKLEEVKKETEVERDVNKGLVAQVKAQFE